MDASHSLLLAQPPSARVGTVLRGKWRIDALLGQGGMAAVFAATHRNGHRCAIKMLLPHYVTDADIVRRFAREGYAANTVGHRGVVTVLDDDVAEDGAPFLVMELLEGTSLDALVRKGSSDLDAPRVAAIAHDVLDVLAAAHDRGIIHRDIKPENVFVLRDGTVKVLDFGIARVIDARETSHTQHGAIMGTAIYMPPEQARGHWDQVDAQSDLWSVGATMFVALTRRPLRAGATPNEALLQAMTEPVPRLLSVEPRIPLLLCDVVDRALAFDKRSRWPDARSMQRALAPMAGKDAGGPELNAATEASFESGSSARERAALAGRASAARAGSGRLARSALAAAGTIVAVLLAVSLATRISSRVRHGTAGSLPSAFPEVDDPHAAALDSKTTLPAAALGTIEADAAGASASASPVMAASGPSAGAQAAATIAPLLAVTPAASSGPTAAARSPLPPALSDTRRGHRDHPATPPAPAVPASKAGPAAAPTDVGPSLDPLSRRL